MPKKTTIDQVKAKAQQGDHDAQKSLALLYELGLEQNEPDLKAAKEWWAKAQATGDDPLVTKSLANIIGFGLDGEKPDPKAAKDVNPAFQMPPTEKLIQLGKTAEDHVLCIDDSKTMRAIMRKYLSDLNVPAQFAYDGKHALDHFIAHRNHIRLIFTDLDMPRMNGVEFIYRVRQLDTEVPIVVMTAHSRVDVINKVRPLGVQGWIVKPATKQAIENFCAKINGKS